MTPAEKRFHREAGVRLREVREALGESQTAMGKRLGMDQSALSRCENGFQPIPLDVAIKAGIVFWAKDFGKRFVNPFRVAKDADMDLGTRRLR